MLVCRGGCPTYDHRSNRVKYHPYSRLAFSDYECYFGDQWTIEQRQVVKTHLECGAAGGQQQAAVPVDYSQLVDFLVGCYYSEPKATLNQRPEEKNLESLSDKERALVEAEVRDLFAKFVFTCMRAVDQWVPIYGNRRQPEMVGLVNHREMCYHFFMSFFHQISITSPQAPGVPPSPQQVCSTFLIQKVVLWMLSHAIEDLRVLIEHPGARIARFTDGLQLMCAGIAEDAWRKYLEAGRVQRKCIEIMGSEPCNPAEDRLYQHLSGFFHHYTVNPTTGEIACCLSDKVASFVNSEFRVYLVDDFGSLMNLLYQLSKLERIASNGKPTAMAVDLEGLNLCRDGAMSLAQLCLSSNPKSVYVVDVTRLGFHAFHATTHTGTSLKSIMEDARIEKVFYDPRNDVDALYYQFNVAPQNVFDLQLAEVALRRARGLTVRYVIGLFKCLIAQPELFTQSAMMDFARRINDAGKALYEPKHGGSFKVFTQRPLHTSIIVYASHDVRYLLPLKDLFTKRLKEAGDNLYERVCKVSTERAQWYKNIEYVKPTSEAPDI
ncbi:hypothetical protein FOL46_009139 [Perkinsus olseni]|uniref:3'-5' exonuclease domain-containing protein n=1 Tax=Perkinsus olseni TaxID=32597 RepID=A0A7J6MWH3_PEROL|nr:hypothetical protein FOL46_009139 [Perkinsus olseni]